MSNAIELRKVMASMETEPAKRMKIFVNGDSRFLGKDIVVNRRSIRTWDSFLQNVTNDLGNHEAIRSICTPIGGTRVRSLEELQDRSNYVALGSGPFKKIGYLNLHQRQQPKFSWSPKMPVKQHHDDGRFTDRSQNNIRLRELPFDAINIFVYANGQPLEPARRVNIPRRLMVDWEAVLEEINHRVPLGTSTKSLYTLEGFLINNPEFLENGVYYVAVGTEFGGFKKANYGVLGRPSFRLPGKLDHRHPGYGDQSNRRSNQPGSFSLSSRASSDSETVHSRKSYPGTTRTTHMHRFKKPASDFGSTNFYAQPSQRNTNRYQEVDYDKDEGGVFKATNRRRETHGATEVSESKDTRIDVPIDMVEAQEIEEEDELPTARRNIAQQKNKLQKNNLTKETTTNKRPLQLPAKSTDQHHDNNTSRQGNSRRQGNENKDVQQPALNSQRANGKLLVDAGHRGGGGTVEKHLPLAVAAAESKTIRQRQKLIPEAQHHRANDSKTIKEDVDNYYHSNEYQSDDGSDNHGNGGFSPKKGDKIQKRENDRGAKQSKVEAKQTHHSNGYHSDDGSDNHGNGFGPKKGDKTQKRENDKGAKQSKVETKQNGRNRDIYEDEYDDEVYEETKTKIIKGLETNGQNKIVNRHGNGYHHDDDDDDRSHDNSEKRAPGKRIQSKDRNVDVKENSKKLPVVSKITKAKNQKAEEQLLREKAATKIQATYRGYRTRQQLRNDRVKQLVKGGPKQNAAKKAPVAQKQTRQRNGGKAAAAADDDDDDDDDDGDVRRHLNKTRIVVQRGKQTISQRQEQTKTNKKQAKSSPRTVYGKKENEAATKIQSAYRGYSVRKQMDTERKLLTEKTKSRGKEPSPSKQKQVNVTKKANEADRTRKIQKNERNDLDDDDDEHCEQETKSYPRKKKDTIQKHEPEKTGKKETKNRKSIFDKLRDEAAVKIQSTYRGYKTRKDLTARQNDLGKRRTFNKSPPLQTTSLKRNVQQKDSAASTPVPVPRKTAASRTNLQQQQPKQQQQLNLDLLYDGFERQKPSP